MNEPPFVSYAQNGEDVILWRALQSVEHGCYVDVGANHPEDDSVSKAFYDRGWRGLNVEPVAEFAAELRAARSRDIVAEVAVTESDGGQVVLHEFAGTGLSTLREENVPDSVRRGFAVRERSVPSRTLGSLVAEHLPGTPVHFCKIDIEGAEAEALASVDLTAWRPWVLVVEATRPNSTQASHEDWEPRVLSSGYQLCLFDGVSRYYVSDEHAKELGPALSYPACALDGYIPAATAALRMDMHELREQMRLLQEAHHDATLRLQTVDALDAEIAGLRAELVRWRGAVLEHWANAVTADRCDHPADESRAELAAMRRTLSWRVTTPLRAVRSRQLRAKA